MLFDTRLAFHMFLKIKKKLFYLFLSQYYHPAVLELCYEKGLNDEMWVIPQLKDKIAQAVVPKVLLKGKIL